MGSCRQFSSPVCLRSAGRGTPLIPAGRRFGIGRLLAGWLLGVSAVWAGAGIALAGEAPAAGERLASHPAFLFQPVFASNEGSVYGVYEARHADLVLVQGGFDSGFQNGMVCRVLGADGEVGEIMLVEVRNNCSAALILQLEAGKIIEPGHSVRIKTVTF